MIYKQIKQIKDVVQGKAPIGHKRSSQWPSVRKQHIKENPTCAVCGGTDKIEVHHIKSFHEHPELELEPTNLLTMCESKSYGIICHLLVGHWGSYKLSNPNVKKEAAAWLKKLTEKHKLSPQS